MCPSSWSIEIVTSEWPRFGEVLDLCYAELYGPLGIPRDSDWYHAEPAGELAVALDQGGRLLGSARLLPDPGDGSRQVRQVVVASARRGEGLGHGLMLALERVAVEEGATQVWLNARSTAVDFYVRLGYEVVSDEFVIALSGLPHRRMNKRVAKPGA